MGITVQDLSAQLSDVVEQVGKSVVRVEGVRRGGRSSVSGLVIDAQRVLTVAHAVRSDEVSVEVEGRTVKARVIGRDDGTDLALLAVDEPLPVAQLVTAEGLKVGQLVLRLARPGETVRATSGIVSTVGQKPWRSPQGGQVDFFLETDAPHQPGFSGGPLVDLQGRVLGLMTSGLLRGGSVAVPTATIRRVVAQLEQYGRVRRSYLGLQLQPVRLPDTVQQTTGEEIGLLVTDVAKDGPAEKAGIRFGDTVLHLGDDTVRTLEDFYAWLRADHADQQVPVKLFRDGQVVTQQVTLGAR